MQFGLFCLSVGVSDLIYRAVHIKNPQLTSCLIWLSCGSGFIIGIYLVRPMYKAPHIPFPLTKRNEDGSNIIHGNFILLEGSSNLPVPKTLKRDIKFITNYCSTITVSGTTQTGIKYCRNFRDGTFQLISDKRRFYFSILCLTTGLNYLLKTLTDNSRFEGIRNIIEVVVLPIFCALLAIPVIYYYRGEVNEHITLEEAPNNPQEIADNNEPQVKVTVKDQFFIF